MYAPAPLKRQLNRSGLLLLGPAFVAAVAYVDPGNFATNIAAGTTYGYLLCWVVVGANLMAVLVQYLAAKASIATGRTLPQLCRDQFKRFTSTGLWAQAELVAIATDLAEVVGGAIALNLLFGVPLLVGGVITGLVSFALLIYQSKRGQRPFEAAIGGLLAVVLIGFVVSTVQSHPSGAAVIGGLVPRLDGTDSLVLAAGMLGATVMPHAIWLHGALVTDRHGRTLRSAAGRLQVLKATRLDVGIAMALAGAVNLAMVVVAAAALQGSGADTLEAAYQAFGDNLGRMPALLFTLALLASGFASSSVGTYAGSVILEGFWKRHVPLAVRRLITLLPALVILAIGIDPSRALVVSQVVLSFGIPCALWPLVRITASKSVMGELVNRWQTTLVACVVAAAITSLNVVLIVLTVRG
ncbi:Nramp family divalent metal transporter [Kribbella sandramycini]|uniref:Manganese transport protein n=1 Tax=Kribbella sandramycini TaxID=60450 RepID=A0A7Y4L1P9_9ACTN|nr:Nramp family divalent metal transporter [Kribbella sandramycini]MBB6566665.1 manganese transport protein [Kribbella sandramycini]NOL42683.1 Nramp family divalent metal transporter [Kribbella sandramycini]